MSTVAPDPAPAAPTAPAAVAPVAAPSRASRVKAFVKQLVKMEEADPAVRAGVRAALVIAVLAAGKAYGVDVTPLVHTLGF